MYVCIYLGGRLEKSRTYQRTQQRAAIAAAGDGEMDQSEAVARGRE